MVFDGVPLFTSCVTLSKLVRLSVLHFFLFNEANTGKIMEPVSEARNEDFSEPSVCVCCYASSSRVCCA